jgi:hypothetical protein
MGMFRVILIAALAWACALPAAAASKLFAADAPPLKLTITGPLPALVAAAKKSTNPYPATLQAVEGAGPAQSFAVELKARGLTRRTAGYCAFPPLWLTFDKTKVKGTLFNGQHRLKLVTYCRDQDAFEQRIVLEYLAYRIYNVVTPFSFRVRGADVTYRSGPADKGVTRFGFLLEDPDDVGDRSDRDVLKIKSHDVAVNQLDPRAAARASLLEFLLGNLDWEFIAAPEGDDCCHNVRLLAARKATGATARAVVPVPYDFDFSGFVDSPYAGPAPGVEIANLRERYYRGYCSTSGEAPAAAQEFRAKKAEILAVVSGEPRLTDAYRKRAVSFLEEFFDLIDNPAQVDRRIVKHCR